MTALATIFVSVLSLQIIQGLFLDIDVRKQFTANSIQGLREKIESVRAENEVEYQKAHEQFLHEYAESNIQVEENKRVILGFIMAAEIIDDVNKAELIACINLEEFKTNLTELLENHANLKVITETACEKTQKDIEDSLAHFQKMVDVLFDSFEKCSNDACYDEIDETIRNIYSNCVKDVYKLMEEGAQKLKTYGGGDMFKKSVEKFQELIFKFVTVITDCSVKLTQ